MGICTSKSKPEKEKKTYQLEVLNEHTGAINVMCMSEDGSVLCTGSEDR